MCSCLQRNKNPQTVKLSPRSSVRQLTSTSLLGRYAADLDADAPKPPAYPFSNSIFKELRTKNKPHAVTSAPFPAVPPDIQCHDLRRGFRFLRSASLRRVVFGEAVFTDGRVTPQEEKTHQASFFCHTPCLKAFSAVATHCQAVGRPDLARVGRAKVA